MYEQRFHKTFTIQTIFIEHSFLITATHERA